MERKYESLTIFEFQKRFPDEKACIDYLNDLKYAASYLCPRCGNKKYCKGNKEYIKQCTKCNYLSSPTSGTLFHKVKSPLHKAFYIVYYVGTNKKGISSTELSRKLGLRQKTCWLFRQKVMRAMKSSGKSKMTGKIEIYETHIELHDKNGKEKKKKNRVVFAIEKRGKGVRRIYGQVVNRRCAKEFGEFIAKKISSDSKIKTIKWAGYNPLKKEFKNMIQVPTNANGRNFPDSFRIIFGFKAWLRGIHHKVEYVQAYIDEYTYRFNRNKIKKTGFKILIEKMVNSSPCPYKNDYWLCAYLKYTFYKLRKKREHKFETHKCNHFTLRIEK